MAQTERIDEGKARGRKRVLAVLTLLLLAVLAVQAAIQLTMGETAGAGGPAATGGSGPPGPEHGVAGGGPAAGRPTSTSGAQAAGVGSSAGSKAPQPGGTTTSSEPSATPPGGQGTAGGGSPSPTVPPQPAITSGPGDPTASTGGTFTFEAEHATGFLCATDAEPAFVPCSSPRDYPAGTFQEGRRWFRVVAVAGSVVSDPALYSWTVDLTAPPPPTFAVRPGDPNTSDSAHFELVDVEGGISYRCSLDGAGYAACAATLDVVGLSPGRHTLCVKAVDRAGNHSEASCISWLEGSTGGAPVPGGPSGGDASAYIISGSVTAALHPGGPAVPIEIVFSSVPAGNGGGGADGVVVSGLVVTIASVTGPNITASRPCSAADFALGQFSGGYPFHLPQGSSSLSSLGFASTAWPALALLDRPSNQDGCKGATVHLAFAGAS